jgi:hypothetical protein
VNQAAALTCPMHATPGQQPAWPHEGKARSLLPQQVLHLPLHRRAFVQMDANPSGLPLLRVYYGEHDIEFDDPHFFAFAQTLAQTASFVAADACQWGPGYAWGEVAPLLQDLLDADILRTEVPPAMAREVGPQPSPLTQAQTGQAREWRDCEAITQELTGRPLALGHLELVVPIFRVAHMALDADGRQVGESNVFPMPLRLDIPTDWRTCIYEGSRHLDDKPMNVTALKAMRAHWPVALTALARIREAYVKRYPVAAQGMTLADVECLATLVLAVPAYLMMRADQAVPNGALHPALSSMFRVTDGLRMVSHQMLFVPVDEATWAPETPVSARDIHDYAERNQSFHSNHGVCAGPRQMIDTFLALMVEGRWPADLTPADLPAEVQHALEVLEPAFDYGLLGLQAHAVVFSLWPLQTRCWARLGELFDHWPEAQAGALQGIRAHLADTLALLANQSLHATETWRRNRELVYAAIHAHTGQGLGQAFREPLQAWLDAAPLSTSPQALAAPLHQALAMRLNEQGARSSAELNALTELLLGMALRTQAILVRAQEVQARINSLLGRTQPERPFHALDIDIHVLLQGREARRLPHLLDGLLSLLGLELDISAEHINVRSTSARKHMPTPEICPHGVGR